MREQMEWERTGRWTRTTSTDGRVFYANASTGEHFFNDELALAQGAAGASASGSGGVGTRGIEPPPSLANALRTYLRDDCQPSGSADEGERGANSWLCYMVFDIILAEGVQVPGAVEWANVKEGEFLFFTTIFFVTVTLFVRANPARSQFDSLLPLTYFALPRMRRCPCGVSPEAPPQASR